MVIAEQMEIAVNQQPATFVPKCVARLPRLPSGRVDRNHDVAKDRRSAADRTTQIDGKRQNIGGTIDAAMTPVQPTHVTVTNNGQADDGSRSVSQ